MNRLTAILLNSRARKRVALIAAALAVALLPYAGIPSSVIGSANKGAIYAIVAIALVVLTGWVGQISLGHAALVGIAAFGTGHIVGRLGLPFPLNLPLAAAVAAGAAALLGAVALRVRGLYLAVATLVFNWMASEFLFRQSWFIRFDSIPDRPIGVPGANPYFDFTDRRIFFLVAWATVAAVAFAAANFRDSKTGRAFFAVRGSEMAAASLGIDVTRYKLLAFAVSGAIAGVAGNLEMSGSRVVAADQFTFTSSLFFLSIAVVGGLGSLGGVIVSALIFAGLSEVFFRIPTLGGYLQVVSNVMLVFTLLVYPGGLAALARRLRPVTAVASSAVNQRLERAALRLAERGQARGRIGARLSEARSRLGPDPLGRMIRAIPRPSVKLPPSVAGRLSKVPGLRSLATNGDGHGETIRVAEPLDFSTIVNGSVPALQTDTTIEMPVGHAPESVGVAHSNGHEDRPHGMDLARAHLVGPPIGDRDLRPALIEASHVTVRFGGLTAVNDASLVVREGEIVGLIGPNGAGKTTLFNAIAGYNSPAAGTIRLYGQNVTGLPVFRRAQVGVARTFQLIQLFSDLTVYDNLMVATHVHNPTGFLSHVIASDRSLVSEREARKRVDAVLNVLELGDLATRRTGDLPFGILRMVEVARALVTGFRVIMLDEPASGLDNNETDKLMEVLHLVRGLGVTLLLIEHDVRMVTEVSDYMYVLDQGRMIAQGPSEQVQRDPAVIAAYLGEPAKEEEPVAG